jgi:hypothetical protein
MKTSLLFIILLLSSSKIFYSRVLTVKRKIYSRQAIPTSLTCNDPSTKELEKIFFKYQSDLKQIEDLINLPGNTFKYIPDNIKTLGYSVPSTNETMIYGEKECNKIKAQNSFHNRGLCPWYTAFRYRTDRYPFFKTEAICNCKDCSHLKPQSAFEYKCKPHEILKPVLYRTEKCVNSTFEWNKGLERVAIACLCKSDFDKQIERKR